MKKVMLTAVLGLAGGFPTMVWAHDDRGFESVSYATRGACEAAGGAVRSSLREENANYDVFCERSPDMANPGWVLHVHQFRMSGG